MAMVMMSYDLFTFCQREDTDERMLGDLFFYYGEALPDIRIVQALNWLIRQLIGTASTYQEVWVVINQIMSEFMKKLPKSHA